ncbi:MAG: hypothetical protein LBG43_01825, partial [Treponema sp.]|nr:hypothetical protein [Treponema sp.]
AGTLGQPFLTRTVQKRLAVENKRTLDEPRKKRRRGRVEATITRDSLSGVPEREAVLQLRHAPFTIKKPDILNPVKTPPESIEANGVSVKGESRDGMGAETSFPMMTGGPASAPEEAYEYVG